MVETPPWSPPSPPARHRALVYPSVVPICASCVILDGLDGHGEAYLMQYCSTSHVLGTGPTRSASLPPASP